MEFKELLEKATKGDANAQKELGYYFEHGQDVEQDYKEAFKWYKKAALQEHIIAQFNLGLCYFNGRGVKENLGEAANWFKKAALQGDAYAQFLLGVCYEVRQNYKEAFNWYTKAFKLGLSDSKAFKELKDKLIEIYINGFGCKRNYDKAMEIFQTTN